MTENLLTGLLRIVLSKYMYIFACTLKEMCHEKTGLMTKRLNINYCKIHGTKLKALFSSNAHLICVFVFAYEKADFS